MSKSGFRVFKKIARPDRALIEGLAPIPTANIGDVMNRMSCMQARIRPYNRSRMAGPALTVRVRGGDNLILQAALDLAEPGDVVVVDGMGDINNSLIGENMLMWAERRGVAGVVIDGAVRDAFEISEMKIPVFAAGVQPNGPYKNGPGEINVPISCGGIAVHPGDIIIGDGDGVVVIPPALGAEVLKDAVARNNKDIATRDQIRAGAWDRSPFSDDALRKLGCEIIDDIFR